MSKVLKMPKIGVNMKEAKIVAWIVKEGDIIREDDHILDAETDKAVQEIYSTMSGTVAKILVSVGDDVLCQSPIAILCEPGEKYAECSLKQLAGDGIDVAGGSGESTVQIGEQPETELENAGRKEDRLLGAAAIEAGGGKERIRISPLARKLAKNMNINLNELQPAKPHARIVKADILAYVSDRASNPLPAKGKSRDTIPYTGIRRLIGERMTESKHTKPSVALTLHADAGRLIEWRNALKKAGKPVSYNDMLVMTVARALGGQPIVNSRLDGDEIQILNDVNIGVAVETERGLTVPVIKNANHKGLLEISEELRTKVEAVNSGKASVEDLTGGTFTITNLGAYEIEHFIPIINPPECCILGVGSILREPVAGENDAIVIKSRMLLTLVFDHRIVDGVPAAKFLQKVKHLIEWPLDLMS